MRKYLKEYPELLDVLSATSSDRAIADGVQGPGRNSLHYPPHAPMNDILAGLRSRKYFRCTIRCSGRPSSGSGPAAESWKTCYAIVHKADGTRVSVAIEGERSVNRALDGDVVAIAIIQDEEEKYNGGNCDVDESFPLGVGEVISSTAEPSSFQIEGLSAPSENEDNKLTGKDQGRKEVKTSTCSTKPKTVASLQAVERGRVVGIIRRNWRQYAGSMVPLESLNHIDKNGANASNFLIGMDVFYVCLLCVLSIN